MRGLPPAVTVHTSSTLPDRPTRAAKEQAEPDPAVAIATRPGAGASGCAIADGERTILRDRRGVTELARRAFAISTVRTSLRRGSSIPPNDDPSCEAPRELMSCRRRAGLGWSRGVHLTEKAGGWRGSASATRGRSAARGVHAGGDRPRARSAGLRLCHCESRRAMEALDAPTRMARAAGGETDLEVILGPVAKRGRAVASARTLAIEHQHDWTGTSG